MLRNPLVDAPLLHVFQAIQLMADSLLHRRSTMKKLSLAVVLGLTAGFVAQGQELKTSTDRSASDYLDNRFGAGLMVGEPTGLSLKYWFNESLAIDGGIGQSFNRNNRLQLHSDVLWHMVGLIDSSHGKWAPYLGAGVRSKFESGEDTFGFRFPIGIAYMLDRHPIDVFFEVAPILDVAPSSRGSFNVAAGARFWF